MRGVEEETHRTGSLPPWWTWKRDRGARSPFRAPQDSVWRGDRETEAAQWGGDGVSRHLPAQIRVGSDDLGDVHRMHDARISACRQVRFLTPSVQRRRHRSRG